MLPVILMLAEDLMVWPGRFDISDWSNKNLYKTDTIFVYPIPMFYHHKTRVEYSRWTLLTLKSSTSVSLPRSVTVSILSHWNPFICRSLFIRVPETRQFR